MTFYLAGLGCSGLMNLDTIISGKVAMREVFNDSKKSKKKVYYRV